MQGGAPSYKLIIIPLNDISPTKTIYWLVVWLPFFIFPLILEFLIIPIDQHIFQDGVALAHQPDEMEQSHQFVSRVYIPAMVGFPFLYGTDYRAPQWSMSRPWRSHECFWKILKIEVPPNHWSLELASCLWVLVSPILGPPFIKFIAYFCGEWICQQRCWTDNSWNRIMMFQPFKSAWTPEDRFILLICCHTWYTWMCIYVYTDIIDHIWSYTNLS